MRGKDLSLTKRDPGEDATAEENMTETNTGLREGQEMPNFELPDEEGLPYGLFEHLQMRPLVLVFYRGTGDRTATGRCCFQIQKTYMRR